MNAPAVWTLFCIVVAATSMKADAAALAFIIWALFRPFF